MALIPKFSSASWCRCGGVMVRIVAALV